MKPKLTVLLLGIILTFSISAFSQMGANAILRGQLQKSNSKPLAYTEIELVPVESKRLVVDARLVSISSVSGKFTFFDVPDGKYTLSINFDDKPTDLSPYTTYFYPKTEKRSEAEIFEVKNRSLLKTVTFQLPPALPQRKITGKVVWKNNEPIEGAYIFIRDLYFDLSFSIGRLRSGKRGEFSIPAFEGRTYQVGAILYEKQNNSLPDFWGKVLAATESDIFELNQKTANVNLVLGRTDDDNRLRDKYVGQIILKDDLFQKKVFNYAE